MKKNNVDTLKYKMTCVIESQSSTFLKITLQHIFIFINMIIKVKCISK